MLLKNSYKNISNYVRGQLIWVWNKLNVFEITWKQALLIFSMMVAIGSYCASGSPSSYIEGQTEVTAQLGFIKPHVKEIEMVIPKLDWKIWNWFVPLLRLISMYFTTYENHPIVFKDARKADHLKYEVNGFTLEKLESKVKDWHSEEGQKQYEKEIFAIVRKLHPEAKHLYASDYLFRGGDHPDANPAAVGAPHLDFHQNWDEYLKYANYSESDIWKGTPKDVKRAFILGIWKPIEMKNPVSDFCFAVGDAVHFSEDDAVANKIEMGHMNNGTWQEFKAITAAIKFNPAVEYYYYPFQTNDEVLVFRQLTFDKPFANPHVAFKNDNSPAEYTDTRKSIETRVFVFV